MLYVKSCFAIAGSRFLSDAEEILAGFNEEIQTACIGSVSECFEGDPPFRARGCLSQATSVGALLHIKMQIDAMKGVKAEKPAKSAKKPAVKKEAKPTTEQKAVKATAKKTEKPVAAKKAVKATAKKSAVKTAPVKDEKKKTKK